MVTCIHVKDFLSFFGHNTLNLNAQNFDTKLAKQLQLVKEPEQLCMANLRKKQSLSLLSKQATTQGEKNLGRDKRQIV